VKLGRITDMEFENRLLRKFGLRRDEMTGEWRKRHNEELHNLHFSIGRIEMMRWKDM
jgi:hypothetical protein